MSICRECVFENAQKFYNNYKYSSYIVIQSCTVNDQNQHHSFNDKPSQIYSGGVGPKWHKDGELHRENGPASIQYELGYYYYEGRMIQRIESLYVGKTFEKRGSIILVVEKVSNIFYKIMIGDQKFLAVSLDKTSEA